MATRTFTNGGVNDLWSTAGNWDTPPVDNDTVVISTGSTCEFDVDLSGWANGVAGLTITGTLKLTRTAGTYYLNIKAATTISGAGTFDCGASALDAIPFAAKHTITGGAAWYIQGSGGLTMTVYAAEPAITTVMLTALEPVGETVLAIDTDVTGDIWADSDTIHIDDINRGPESEERVIAAGGIAAGTITITAGLTAAKSIGAVLSLITRNVKFIGVGTSGYVCQNFASGKLTVAGGQWTTAAYRIFSGCTLLTISGGTFSGNVYAIYACYTAIISGGVFSGNSNAAVFSTTGVAISGGSFTGNTIAAVHTCSLAAISGGTFKGNRDGVYVSNGVTVSGGTFSGNQSAFSTCSGISILGGTITLNTYSVYACPAASIFAGTINGNSYGLHLSSATMKNVALTGQTTADVSVSVISCFNVNLGSATENLNYINLAREAYSESLDHDQAPGAFEAWTKGGVTSSQAVTLPVGYTQANQTVLESASVEGYWQKEYTVGPGASVNITMNLRKSASMTYLPRCIIFNKAATDPFAGGAGIHTFTMTDSVDTWEAETYTYYNATAADITLVIRFQGKNATGNMFSALTVEQINVDLTTVIANLAIVDGIVDNIQVDTGTDIPASIAALNDLSAAEVNAEVVDVLRTDTLPDSYAVDGVQPTIAQAVLEILQFLTEKEVVLTTVTVNKPDGTTAAMTFTLDDAVSPTSITRAT